MSKIPQKDPKSAQNPTGLGNNDIFAMAQKIAQEMPVSDGENVDMQTMFKHVTESVTKMMGSGEVDMNAMTASLMGNLGKDFMPTQTPPPTQTPNPNSKIILPGQPKPKELKKPTHKEVQNYEELDDDEETEDFAPRTKDIEINLNVTLEDFYNGSEKKLAIRRNRIIKNKDGKMVKQSEKKKLKIPIAKGMRDGGVLRFNKEADEEFGYETGDIVVTLYENSHSMFEREGDNLFIMKDISLYEAFASSCGKDIELTVPHLDGSILKFKTDGKPLHMNDGIRKITGQGMPKYKKEGFGDLYVRFNLVLPKKFKTEDMDLLKKLFPPCNEELYTKGKDINIVTLEEVSEEDLEKLDYATESESDSYDSSEDYTSSDSEREVKKIVAKKK